jgi:hypothetical protein
VPILQENVLCRGFLEPFWMIEGGNRKVYKEVLYRSAKGVEKLVYVFK